MPKARKEHRCRFCGLTIGVGTDYHSQTLKPWDHPDNEGFDRIKVHLNCREVWLRTAADNEWCIPADEDAFRQDSGERALTRPAAELE